MKSGRARRGRFQRRRAGRDAAEVERGELDGASGGGLLGDGFFGNMEAALVGEEQGCAAVVEEFGDLVAVKAVSRGTAVLPLAMIPR